MNSLSAKLSVALLVIVGLMGSAFFVVDRVNTRLYYEELTQRLNAPIAMYVTGQRTLITNGQPDLMSLSELASHAMVINPTAEIYLTDTNGNILGHGLPPDTVLQDRIDLAPVKALIGESAPMPVLGDDPRSHAEHKVFSAAEVIHNNELQGYLYVVLGGKTYEALASDISGSYVGRATLVALLVIVATAAAVGLLVFNLLTRRLKNLSRKMRRIAEPDNAQLTPAGSDHSGDEIERLARTFDAMSARIADQFAQLKENDRLRRELVSNISHDLRTPLSAMQGYVETLIIKGDRLPAEERDRYLRIARRHTIRLGTLIGDLFELSKLDSASISPEREAFSLAELVQDVALEFQLDAEQKDVALSIRAEPGAALTVGDIGLIQRVLENLVRNAIKFTPANGEVTIAVAQRPQSLAVTVSDTGPGIAQDDLPRIFDRFYRAVNGEEARSDSSGLGLAIVKRILDLHESRITVESKLDAGTTFEFELPIYQQAA